MIQLTDRAKEVLREINKAFKETSGGIANMDRFIRKLRKNLAQKLNYLHSYACHDGETLDLTRTKCVMGGDFAPLSFSFTIHRKNAKGEYEYWFNGGLLYHSDHDGFGNGGPPTFSVCIGQTEAGWSVHT